MTLAKLRVRTKTARSETGISSAWDHDPYIELMLRVQAGDDDAFQAIVDHFTPRVFGYLFKQLRDRTEAEDGTQEVFLRLYRYRDRYLPRAGFNTWVFFIAHNVARNALRSRKRRPCVPQDFGINEQNPFLNSPALCSDEPPSRPLEREELAGVVRNAIEELTGKHRLAIKMHQLEGRSYHEVASVLEMTPNAAKSLLHRARNKLRDTLKAFVQM